VKEILEKKEKWKEYVEFLKERRSKLEVPPVIEPGTGGGGGGALGGEPGIPPPIFDTISSDTTETESAYSEARDSDDDRFDLADTEDIPSDDDADDYDVEQAEILLTKQEVQALA